MKSENIAAISTGAVASGVGVIRISGDSPLEIAKKIFKPSGKIKVSEFVPNMMYAGEILADGFTDYGMCVYFKAPKSFTGEDTIEFHCHGGIAITRGILNLCPALFCWVRRTNHPAYSKSLFLEANDRTLGNTGY